MASDTVECKNARITHTMLGREDHGILTFWLMLDYGGAGQGFGGYALDGCDPSDPERKRRTYVSMECIAEILRVLDVGSWEKIPGTPCRVMASWGKVDRIGHYLRDEWVDLAELFKPERTCGE